MLIIDRFEGDKVVLEYDKETFDLPKKAVPEDAKEGDVLKITVDKYNSKKRREAIKELSEELFE